MDIGSYSLSELQNYVKEREIERGFDKEDAISKCLLLGEEVGELFKAVRIISGLTSDHNSLKREVSHELADVLNFILAIANRFDIDLGEAFEAKEKINATRIWHKAANTPD